MPFVRLGRKLLALTALGLSFFATRTAFAEVEAEEIVLEEEEPTESDDPALDEGTDSAGSNKFDWPRRKVVLYARQGVMLFAPGQRVTERCTGGACPVERLDYTQAMNLQPGFDVLLHMPDRLRLGLGFTYSPGMEVSVEQYESEDDVYTIGSEVVIPFSIEYVVSAGKEVAFPLRFQPSLLFVFPSKVQPSDTCEQSVGLSNCVYRQKPYPGFLAGMSGGVLWNLAPIGIRADAVAQYVYETATAWEAKNLGTNTDESQYRSYQGFRFLLQVGLEI